MTLGDAFISVEGVEGSFVEPVTRATKELSGDMVAVLNVMNEVGRALAKNVPIDRHFEPKIDLAKDQKLVKGRWVRGHKRLVSENPSRKWNHCDTPDEALAIPRTFTCTMQVFNMIPEKRDG